MSRYKSFNNFENFYATIHLLYDNNIDIVIGSEKLSGILKLSSLEALNLGQSLIATALYEINEREKILKLEKGDDLKEL